MREKHHLTQRALKIEGRHAYLAEQPEIAKLLDEYNDLLPTLNQIVSELQEKAGVRKLKAFPAILSLDYVDARSLGCFNPLEPDMIDINALHLLNLSMLGNHYSELGSTKAKHLLHILLIHESMHAVSHQESANKTTSVDYVVGLSHKILVSKRLHHRYGLMLNEAITEHLACVVYAEALRRRGQRPATRDVFKEALSIVDDQPYSGYQDYRALWYQFLKQKSEEWGVSEATLWQVVVRQYFNNEVDCSHFLKSLIQSSNYRVENAVESDFAQLNGISPVAPERLLLSPDQEYLLDPAEEDRHIEVTRSALFKK